MTTRFPLDLIDRTRSHIRMGYSRDSLVDYFGAIAAHHLSLRVTRDLLVAAGYPYKDNKTAEDWEESERIRDKVERNLREQATDALIAAAGPVRVLTIEERQAVEEENYSRCETMAALAFEDAAYGRRDSY